MRLTSGCGRQDVTVKHFPTALDWGCNAGSIYKSLVEHPQRASIGHLLQCDSTAAMLDRPDFPPDHPRFKTSKRVVRNGGTGPIAVA
jgi:hypothetical protein